jgi:hypothetical protein
MQKTYSCDKKKPALKWKRQFKVINLKLLLIAAAMSIKVEN